MANRLEVNDTISDSSHDGLKQRERRQTKRIVASLPLRVKGISTTGIKFDEVTRSINVSADGVLFLLKHALETGSFLEITLPLSRSMQRTVTSKQIYQATGRVVRVEPVEDDQSFKIAVKFLNTATRQYHAET